MATEKPGLVGSSTNPIYSTGVTGPDSLPVSVTPGDTNAPHQINVTEYGGNVVGDPQSFFTTDNPSTTDLNESMFLSQRNEQTNPNTAGTNIPTTNAASNAIGGSKSSAVNSTTSKANAGLSNSAQVAQIKQPTTETSQTYDARKDIAANTTQAAQGTVSSGGIDTNIGQADYVQGQAAQEDLETVNPKATVRGQLEEMESDWVDPKTGETVIPLYAQGAARSVSQIAAFQGVTGTAQIDALATAMQEASITMASADAQFFQTLTLSNLNNRQETAINNANILANMSLQNADNRLAAAIQNSQQFLQMDLANLDNRQQASIVDSQARTQSILSYANEENVTRRFNTTNKNELNKFYDQMGVSISEFNANQLQSNNQFNANQVQTTNQFNANQIQSNNQFNSTMEDSRQKWYANMQYQIDQSNAEWRRNVTLAEDAQSFEAARQDVNSMIGVSNEQLSQLWDRSDSLLDYLWKTADNEAERDHELVLQNLKTQAAADAADAQRAAENEAAIGSLLGTITSTAVSSLIGGLFS